MRVWKQQLEPGMEQLSGSNWESKTRLCIIACLFKFCAERVMQNAGLEESQAGINTARRNINLRYADNITLMLESEEELKTGLMRMKELSEK